MIHYRDKTFCPFYETCEKRNECGRALTPEVKAAAANWWGSEDAPIAMFVEKPECHTDSLKKTIMTIAQQLKIKEFPFEIRDSKSKQIYLEDSNGAWLKREYDSDGNQIYLEDSNGAWVKREYDSKGN